MPAEPIPGKSFIEVQFPVSKISKESYKERKAAQSQTLTQLGKWWGRKPLIMIRAALIGILIPSSDDPIKDREIFLKLIGMDFEGLWNRKNKNIPIGVLFDLLTPNERIKWFEKPEQNSKLNLKKDLSRDEKEKLQKIVFFRLGYDQKISYCSRPEECDYLSTEDWKLINEHFRTSANSLHEFLQQIGYKQFNESPIIGDCFCGGGSVPFEAARLGCNVYASDLSPVASLLTWASLNIIGGEEQIAEKTSRFLKEVYDDVDRQIIETKIETNQLGWRGHSYLLCNEVVCPECNWKIPLLPASLIISERMLPSIAIIEPNPSQKKVEISIKSDVSKEELAEAKSAGIMGSSGMKCPNPNCSGNLAPISISSIRHEGTNGLRLWTATDIIPQSNDIFQDRLYSIQWKEDGAGRNQEVKWHFHKPTQNDLETEDLIFKILKEKWEYWRNAGYVPIMKIEPGEETTRLQRERGWTHWHHLFTPRQLLYHGMLFETALKKAKTQYEYVATLLAIGRCADWNSKLCRWDPSREYIPQTFYNQALNTMSNYAVRGFSLLKTTWNFSIKSEPTYAKSIIIDACDARLVNTNCHFWITDPPYADAINYHELSEFFLAWYEKILPRIFPNWIPDSRRAFAIRGNTEEFRKGMIASYQNLTNHMPEKGAQIVMFTHQDAKVWADLALIVWASNLQVTAAWCIQTETESAGIKSGNYVKGTVLLILRKRTSQETAFLDEIYPEIESEVKRQLDSMFAIDDKDDPNFGDTDYQLAAYAAALRVLTKYKKIEEIDIDREIARSRQNDKKSPLEVVIENAVKIACDHLVPQGIDSFLWKQLGPEERFYLKGLELESHGEYRIGAYQELARGFGIRNYRDMQESGRANETRLRTASEFKDRFLRDEGFGSSLVRQVLFAVRQTQQENDTAAGKAWLRGLPNYWDRRKDIIGILQYLASIGISDTMPQWQEDAKAARLLAGAVEQDHV